MAILVPWDVYKIKMVETYPKCKLLGITKCSELRETLRDIYKTTDFYSYVDIIKKSKIIHGWDLQIILYRQILRCLPTRRLRISTPRFGRAWWSSGQLCTRRQVCQPQQVHERVLTLGSGTHASCASTAMWQVWRKNSVSAAAERLMAKSRERKKITPPFIINLQGLKRDDTYLKYQEAWSLTRSSPSGNTHLLHPEFQDTISLSP